MAVNDGKTDEFEKYHDQDDTRVTMAMNSGNLSSKFEKDNWLNAEKKLGKFELNVIQCLVNLGNDKESSSKHDLIAIGDDLYMSIRKMLTDENIILDNTIQTTKQPDVTFKKCKPNKKQSNKADQIRIESSKKRITSTVETILKSFKSSEFQPHQAFNSDMIEIKGVGLLYAGTYIVTNKNKYLRKRKYFHFVLGIMVAIQKFVNNCFKTEGKSIMNSNEKSSISQVLISDMKKVLATCMSIYPYDGFTIYDYAPELLIYTDYDRAIPSTEITPRKHQIDLINNVKNNFENGFMTIYNPMIGAGKTTSLVALSSFVSTLRISQPAKYGKLQIIFACNLTSVKNQAANICYNGNIKFAIAGTDNNSNTYRIVNHFMCKSDAERFVIITSPEIAHKIITKSEHNTDYILYLDEPTMGADIVGSEPLKNNMLLMTSMPNRVILSSATFPNTEFITDITDNFIKKYPLATITAIYSDEIQIGCHVKTYENEFVVPHLGSTTRDELKHVIEVIKKCPFLGRTYTPHVVKTLFNMMKKSNITDLPNIDELFMNVDNMSSDKVRQIAMSMLSILSDKSDIIIKKICKSKIITDKVNIQLEVDVNDEHKKTDICDDFDWDTTVENEDDPQSSLDFTKIGTTQAYRLQNTTLIAIPTPVEFSRNIFKQLIQDIYNSPIDNSNNPEAPKYKNTSNIVEKYQKEMSIFVKNRTILERNTDNEYKLDQLLQEYDDQKPKLKFPDNCQINTSEHINKYASSNSSKIVNRFTRSQMILETLPFDTSSVPDDIMTLLFAGIGIYVANHRDIDDIYLKKVLELASDGKLAYLIADSSICYGTNYPINRVIITDEFANVHSINTLFQLMGRAGRVGKSWMAEAYVTDSIAKRIVMYTRNMNESKTEAINMTDEFNKLLENNEVIPESAPVIPVNIGKLEVLYCPHIETQPVPEKHDAKMSGSVSVSVVDDKPVNHADNWRNGEQNYSRMSQQTSRFRSNRKVDNNQKSKFRNNDRSRMDTDSNWRK